MRGAAGWTLRHANAIAAARWPSRERRGAAGAPPSPPPPHAAPFDTETPSGASPLRSAIRAIDPWRRSMTDLTQAQIEQRRLAPLKHGARARYRLAPRAAEIADDLRTRVPVANHCDEPSIRLLALLEAQIEAARDYLDEHGVIDEHGQARSLNAQLSTWQNSALRLYNALGMTPTSREKLGLDIARRQEITLRDLSVLTDRELAEYRSLTAKIERAALVLEARSDD
jgi:hypothetical protein